MSPDAKIDTKEAQAPEARDSSRLTMSVKVYSPFSTYFDGEADSVTAENKTGPFDVLPHHHNFITLLLPGEITIRTSKDEQKVRISGGVMHVRADHVTVFLDV